MVMQDPWPWWLALLLAYAVSLGLGWYLIPLFHKWTKRLTDEQIKLRPDKRLAPGLTSRITGTLERAVFTPLMIAQPEVAVAGMGGWLALKMAASWGREIPDNMNRLQWISHAFLGLQTGFASMALAGVAGALARWLMCLPIIR